MVDMVAAGVMGLLVGISIGVVAWEWYTGTDRGGCCSGAGTSEEAGIRPGRNMARGK